MSKKTLDLESITAAGVRHLQPYQPGKPAEELERELGLSSIIKLASNENPWGASATAAAAVSNVLSGLERYPDGSGHRLTMNGSVHRSFSTGAGSWSTYSWMSIGSPCEAPCRFCPGLAFFRIH